MMIVVYHSRKVGITMEGTHRLIKENPSILFYIVLLVLFLIPIPGSAQDAKISAPVWEIGDEWVYQNTYKSKWEVRVVRTEGNLYVTENSLESDFLAYDKKNLEPKYNIGQTGKRTKATALFIDFHFTQGRSGSNHYRQL